MKDAVVYGSLLVLLALQVGLFFYASFRALWKYRHRKTYELVIAAILTFGFLDSMARKPGQGVHNNGSSSFTQYTIQNNGVGVEGAYASQPTSLITTNDFYFSGISVFTNRVELGLSWREGFFSGGEVIDLFAWWPTITNEVKWVGTTAVHPGSTNSLFEISASALGCTNMPSALFLRASERASAASTMNDWDGDGIPDLYEVHNGTNPYIPDASLISRITVGTNGLYQDIASAISASTNFSIVSLNDEVYELSDSLVMPAYPIILEGPQNGYAVVRSKAKVGAVMLTQGQSEKTLFRNLILSLEAQFGFQAGFWVGGNLPWAGVGSAARFENVRIRAPYPDVEYFGWVFYRDETGASLITNCTMNAAGATWAYGISSYNAASNVIQNCAFVNMPTNQGESSAIAQLIRATSNETVRIEVPSAYPNLSWAGYYKNDCFGEDQDSDNDGLSNNDEVFVYDTDPWLADSDSDGILDGEEIVDATNPKDIGSFMTNIEITLTNKVYYVGVTNYVFIGNVEKWDENLLFANSIISCKTNICTEVKAKELSVGVFSDLNRNGRYDVFEDVYVTKCDTSFLAVKHYDYVLGDIDSDGVDDACEMADGSDPYASNSFRISKRVTIKNENNVSGVTNYVYVSQSQDNFEASLCRAFVSGNVTLILNEVVSNRYLYVSCYRDFNRNGTYDESDVAYVWSITKSSDFIEERIIKDCDADGIVDNDEILEGTNPNNRSSYCYGVNATVVGVFSTTNVLKCLAAFGTNIIGMVTVTNLDVCYNFPHCVTSAGERHALIFWDDLNDDNCVNTNEVVSRVEFPPSKHITSTTKRISYGGFDHDKNGLLDWWEHSVGLESSEGANTDSDLDGLVNLHEYWAGTNPLVPDGSNTALSVLCRSVDDRLRVATSPVESMPIYNNYYENASNGVFEVNSSCWATGLDFSCLSVWNNSNEPHSHGGTVISRRHILWAQHWALGVGSALYFRGTNGVVYTRFVGGSSVVKLDGIESDINVAVLTEELPECVVSVPLLSPAVFRNINVGTYLPLLVINQDKKALVFDLSRICYPGDDLGRVFHLKPEMNHRRSFFQTLRGNDSGSPTFLVYGNKLVLVGTHWSSNSDSSVAMAIEKIQDAMDYLSPGYNLKIENFSIKSNESESE